jgi:hypothetical protein
VTLTGSGTEAEQVKTGGGAMAARGGKPAVTVEPRPGGRWAVQKDGTQRASTIHDRKRGAVADARAQTKREGAQLVTKNADGTIGQKDSHGGTRIRRGVDVGA